MARMTDRRSRPPACDVALPPHGLLRARLYPRGWCCDRHTPAAVAGRPEPPPGPGWPAGAWTTPTPQAVARLLDERAIASGKRRSTPGAYRAAQAATRKDQST